MVRTRMLRSDGDIRCVLTALSLLALLATFALPVLGPGLAAYAPVHGHVTLAGYVPANHVHPWDAEATTTSPDPATQASDDGLVFTLANDGDAASGWASATLVPEPTSIAYAVLVLPQEAEVDTAPAAASAAAPSPPPRI